MIFSTYKFLFLFLPVTFCGYFLLNRFRYYSIAKIWLVLASFYFYAQGSPDFFPFFLIESFHAYFSLHIFAQPKEPYTTEYQQGKRQNK